MKPAPSGLCTRFGKRKCLGFPRSASRSIRTDSGTRLTAWHRGRQDPRPAGGYPGGRGSSPLSGSERLVTLASALRERVPRGWGAERKETRKILKCLKGGTREEGPGQPRRWARLAQPLPDGGTPSSEAVGFYWGLSSFCVLLRCARNGERENTEFHLFRKGTFGLNYHGPRFAFDARSAGTIFSKTTSALV